MCLKYISITTLLEVRKRYSLPHTIGKMTHQQFIYQIYGPKDKVDDKQDKVVVIIPANHEGINAQQTIKETCIARSHILNIIYYFSNSQVRAIIVVLRIVLTLIRTVPVRLRTVLVPKSRLNK